MSEGEEEGDLENTAGGWPRQEGEAPGNKAGGMY